MQLTISFDPPKFDNLFLSDGQSRKERALAAVETLLPDLLRAVEEMKK